MTAAQSSASPAPTPAQPNPVTLIDLGPMGIALAEALLAQGHPLTVWNRTPEKADPLVAKGARRAATVADAVDASPLTLVCLKDYKTLYEFFADHPSSDALHGRALVNLNSGTPAQAHAALAWATERGASYLDGAIMVPPYLVGQPGATPPPSSALRTCRRPNSPNAWSPRAMGPTTTFPSTRSSRSPADTFRKTVQEGIGQPPGGSPWPV
ncbi:NAD(P)-binding domain-containing protein [Streptomyces sp. NPDC054866]